MGAYRAALPSMPLVFVYGSLMNARSRESTIGFPVPARRATLRPAAGLHRGWTFRSAPHRMTCLGVHRDPTRAARPVRGMVLRVDAPTLARLDQREQGYDRITLAPAHVHLEGDAALEKEDGEIVYTYAVRHPRAPCAAFPVTSRYRALCKKREET